MFSLKRNFTAVFRLVATGRVDQPTAADHVEAVEDRGIQIDSSMSENRD